MAGPWKVWKTTTQVSHASHRPLEIPHTAQDFHIPTAATTGFLIPKAKPKKGNRPLRGLFLRIPFRIILYWKRYVASGSFLDWNVLRGWERVA